MNYTEVAEAISSALELDIIPVALSFVEAAPAGVRTFDQEVPSACTLWRKGESQVFFASAERHFNCPVGALVMGFDLPARVQEQLKDLVGNMCACGYVSPEEPPKIPTVRKQKKGIVYGPLKDFPLKADLVLLWLTPRQAMLYSEAAGRASWTSNLPTAVFGRPACAALPVALESTESTLSLGCMGMRTFTEINGDRLLAVLPGDRVKDIARAFESTLKANALMRDFYQSHKARFV